MAQTDTSNRAKKVVVKAKDTTGRTTRRPKQKGKNTTRLRPKLAFVFAKEHDGTKLPDPRDFEVRLRSPYYRPITSNVDGGEQRRIFTFTLAGLDEADAVAQAKMRLGLLGFGGGFEAVRESRLES